MAARDQAEGAAPGGLLARLARRLPRTYLAGRRVVVRTLRDGYVHAGNIAYLSLVTLLPLIILITAATVAFGQTAAGQAAIAGVLRALPANVASVFVPVVSEVLEARTGNLLWIGGLVALWTVTTFIEALRDIVHRAFDVELKRSFIQYRLLSLAGTLAAMLLIVFAFVSQLLLVLVLKSLGHLVPAYLNLPQWLDLGRFVTPGLVFLALWAVFKLLAPRGFRKSAGWPGALVTTFAWVGGTLLLGPAFAVFGDMGLTYGALSGVIVALLFFYAVGFALVAGAELNAALASGDRPD